MSLRNLALISTAPHFLPSERSVEVGMMGASDGTWLYGWSEIVASQEALGVYEGFRAGAGRVAAQSLGDIAMAVVVAVIHRAGLVLTEFRVFQRCTVKPISSQVQGACLTALPRNALHIWEALLLTGVLGAFTVLAKGVPIALTVGHLKWVADH